MAASRWARASASRSPSGSSWYRLTARRRDSRAWAASTQRGPGAKTWRNPVKNSAPPAMRAVTPRQGRAGRRPPPWRRRWPARPVRWCGASAVRSRRCPGRTRARAERGRAAGQRGRCSRRDDPGSVWACAPSWPPAATVSAVPPRASLRGAAAAISDLPADPPEDRPLRWRAGRSRPDRGRTRRRSTRWSTWSRAQHPRSLSGPRGDRVSRPLPTGARPRAGPRRPAARTPGPAPPSPPAARDRSGEGRPLP